MRIFELFSGIGANTKVLSNLNIPFKLVGFSEVDKYAIKAFCAIHNVSDNLNFGDISKIDVNNLPDFDLLTFGFPCQDISVAGKQRGMVEGSRSALYFEGLRILKAKLPKYSLIENVKNLVGKKFKDQFKSILNDLESLGYMNYWTVLNAKDYGIPQNRERVFIVSILGEHKPFEWPKPFYNGVILDELLEDEVDEKYFISREKTDRLLEQMNDEQFEKMEKQLTNEVAYALDANYFKGPSFNSLTKSKRQCVPVLTPDRVEKRQNGRRFKEDGDPMFTLTGQDRHGVLKQVGAIDEYNSQACRVYASDGLAVTQCGLGGGLGGKTGLYLSENRIRRLTPKECFRLMGFTDNDFEKAKQADISDTQLYKMAGNSIVVNVLEEIYKKLFERGEIIEDS